MVLIILIILAIFISFKMFCVLTKGICKSNACLVGKTALITGGYRGIGYETALVLASRGCRLIIADRENCDEVKRKITEESGNSNIVTKHFDLGSLESVRALAKDINESEERLDILINNAGAGGLGSKYSKDGIIKDMQVNHFGPFLLTYLLVDLLKKSAPSRIVFVSSIAAFASTLTEESLNLREKYLSVFSSMALYANSKLCNIIAANGFAEKLKGTGVVVNSVHPGIIGTQIYSSLIAPNNKSVLLKAIYYVFNLLVVKPFEKSVKDGAQTTLHVALAKSLENVTGKFFADCRIFVMPLAARHGEFSDKIWKASEKLVKLAPQELL